MQRCSIHLLSLLARCSHTMFCQLCFANALTISTAFKSRVVIICSCTRHMACMQALYASVWDMSEQEGMCHNAQQEVQARRTATPAPNGFVNLCGALVSLKTKATTSLPRQAHFVSTPAMLSALHSSAIALSSGRCLLVSGPSGCGKSCLVHNLAAATHNDDMLELYMDANTDSRALLGSYMCSQTPGEFFWQPGPLSQVTCSSHPACATIATCPFSTTLLQPVSPTLGTTTKQLNVCRLSRLGAGWC